MPVGMHCLHYVLAGYRVAPSLEGSDVIQQSGTAPLDFVALGAAARKLGITTSVRWSTPESFEMLLQDEAPLLVRIQPTEQPPHWVLVWNHRGLYHQVADPIGGVRWLTRSQLKAWIPMQTTGQDQLSWDDGAAQAHFVDNLAHRAQALRITLPQRPTTIFSQATCDAVLRYTAALHHQRAVEAGQEAQRCFDYCYHTILDQPDNAQAIVPPQHWAIDPHAQPPAHTGIIALVITEVTGAPQATVTTGQQWLNTLRRVGAAAYDWVSDEPRYWLGLVGATLVLAAVGVTLQAVLLRSLSGLGLILTTPQARLGAVVLMILFIMSIIWMRWSAQAAVVNFAHRLDGRLRLGLLAVLPTVSSRYFAAFSLGDLFERLTSVQATRQVPQYLAEFALLFFQLIFTIVGLLLIDPVVALLAALRLVAAGFITAGNRIIQIPQVYTRHHLGQLSQFMLDQLRGTTTAQAHRAHDTLRREYEIRLTRWAHSQTDTLQSETWIDGFSRVFSNGLIALMVLVYAGRGGDVQNWLLVLYWAINLDLIGDQLLDLTFTFWRDQEKINRYTALLETRHKRPDDAANALAVADLPSGVAIHMSGVDVRIDDHTILSDIDLHIGAGEHVAVVGPSGAGKSTFAALLLGHQRPSAGEILMDGTPIARGWLQTLHKTTAWIAPNVHLWNDTVLANVRYTGQAVALQDLIDLTDLRPMLERLPQGWQTRLGDGGQGLSGGEGQRVRVARAAQLRQARLVIMDEPFRGLSGEMRRELLARLREYWADATLVYISHDLSLSRTFGRVLVIREGRIVEDGAPEALVQQEEAHYAQMATAYDAMHQTVWQDPTWRRWQLVDGRIVKQ